MIQSKGDSAERKLIQDIRRTILLSQYMRYWGMPEFRTISRKGDKEIEIYSFPPFKNSEIHRFATVGVSDLHYLDNKTVNHEFMMVLPRDLGDSSVEEVTFFMMDIVAYSVTENPNFQEGTTIPETLLAPKQWKPRAILVDTPRAEPKELSECHIGSQTVNLYWLVPIYKDEYELIMKKGLEDFDKLCDQADLSLADINRSSFA